MTDEWATVIGKAVFRNAEATMTYDHHIARGLCSLCGHRRMVLVLSVYAPYESPHAAICADCAEEMVDEIQRAATTIKNHRESLAALDEALSLLNVDGE